MNNNNNHNQTNNNQNNMETTQNDNNSRDFAITRVYWESLKWSANRLWSRLSLQEKISDGPEFLIRTKIPKEDVTEVPKENQEKSFASRVFNVVARGLVYVAVVLARSVETLLWILGTIAAGTFELVEFLGSKVLGLLKTSIIPNNEIVSAPLNNPSNEEQLKTDDHLQNLKNKAFDSLSNKYDQEYADTLMNCIKGEYTNAKVWACDTQDMLNYFLALKNQSQSTVSFSDKEILDELLREKMTEWVNQARLSKKSLDYNLEMDPVNLLIKNGASISDISQLFQENENIEGVVEGFKNKYPDLYRILKDLEKKPSQIKLDC